MARCAHALVLAALLLAAGAHGQTVLNSPVADDPDTIVSGLELIQSVNGVGSFTGRVLSTTSVPGTSSLVDDVNDASGWSDNYDTTNLRGDVLNGLSNALSIASRVTDTIMQKYLWLADTNGAAVYKVDTTTTGTGAIVGAYASRPAAAAGNPVAFAVLQNGDAFVGNAFTFSNSEIGSLTKIQADSATCGGGATSTGVSDVKSWATAGSPSDGCIKSTVGLDDQDADANSVSIAAVGADGFDNVYTLAVNEKIRFAGFLKIYQTPAIGGSATLLIDTYQDPNQIKTSDGNGGFVTATTDGPGAPGGSGLLVDKWGFLWSGGGTYIKGVGRKYIVIRVDTTNAAAKGLQYFYLDHETQALAFDNNGNLWVSGGGGMSHMEIDPDTIGFTWADGDVGTTVLIGTNGIPGGAATSINLLTNQGACGGDTCCEQGNYNTGIATARDTGDVYVANECPSGKVLHYGPDGAFLEVFDVGTYPSSIQVDSANKVWVPILVTTGVNETEARATTLLTIAPGTGNTPTTAADLTGLPFLGGIGDQTGRYTAQPPATGTWTWVHDTNYAGYPKWDGAIASFAGTNYTALSPNPLGVTDPALTIRARSSDVSASGPWQEGNDVADADSTLSLPAGRWVQFTASFVRSGKYFPEIGPQAFGVTPFLRTFSLKPKNNWPTAICQSRTVNADIPASQSDTTFGVGVNGARVCGAALDATTAVDNGSHDPDTAELDTIVPIQPTGAFYNPTQYKLVSASQRYTVATLSVTDAHGGSNQCTENVNIVDTQPPAWKSQYNLNNVSSPNSGDLSDISTLCIWPPNFKYYCWLDVTSNDNDQVIPLYDNCGGSVPMGKQVDGFVCDDSDPRTVEGDCTLWRTGPVNDVATKYNLCVMAQRRTVYTNSARVYQVNFPVTDASTAVTGITPIYRRQVRIPPLWNFQTSGECPRPTYKGPPGVASFYTNAARK